MIFLFTPQSAVILGGIILSPFFAFSSAILFMKDTSPVFHFLYYANFLDNAIKGSLVAIFGFDRAKMDCDDIYCHFSYPRKVLSEFEVDVKIERVLAILLAYAIVTRVFTFYFIKFRLKN